MIFRKLKESHEVKKVFNYSKGDCSLNFTLRIDVKDQLIDFKELLIKALKDIDLEIK